MNIWGHVAMGGILGRERRFGALCTLALLLGCLFPDIVDKPLKMIGVYPWGRTVGHSTLVWAAFHLSIQSVRPGRVSTALHAFSIGWVSHFLADVLDDFAQGVECTGYVFTSWMAWPIWNPDMFDLKIFSGGRECISTFEILFTILGVAWLVRARKGRR